MKTFSAGSRDDARRSSRRELGGSVVEYLILVSFLFLAIGAGTRMFSSTLAQKTVQLAAVVQNPEGGGSNSTIPGGLHQGGDEGESGNQNSEGQGRGKYP